MRQRHFGLAVLTATAALMLGAQARAVVTIAVGDVEGAVSSTASLPVTLSTGGANVAGTQNDITFSGGVGATVKIKAKENGKPDCTAQVKLDGSQFAFQPPGCSGDACTGVRAIIISFSDLSPIADGATLYTCNVEIGANASGTTPLTCSGAGASDPDGNALDTSCTDGSVTVAAADQAVIQIGSTSGNAGQPGLSIDVTLQTPGDSNVAGTQNDITFGSAGPKVPAKENGKPDCTAKVKLDGSQFAFQPPGCTGDACTGVRAIIISFSDLSPIPSGSVLYSCTITTAELAEGDYPLTCSGAGASDPDGNALQTGCTDGTVTVGGVIVPTATETPTEGPEVSPTPTATNTRAVTPTRTSGGGARNDADDGCAIVSPAQSQAGWMLLLPAAMLIWLRRRSR